MRSDNAPTCGHVIWDWNGTLFDDGWLCVELLNDVLRRRGRPPVSPQQYAREFDLPVRAYYERLGFDFSIESFEALAAEFFAQYGRRRFECGLCPGAREALAACAARGVGQSVLSAYQHDALEELLEWHGVRAHFTHVVGLDDHHAGSKTESGLRLLGELDCDPGRVLFVGDTGHDADVARAMGVRCVLIPGGHSTREKLERAGAPVVRALADVAPLLG